MQISIISSKHAYTHTHRRTTHAQTHKHARMYTHARTQSHPHPHNTHTTPTHTCGCKVCLILLMTTSLSRQSANCSFGMISVPVATTKNNCMIKSYLIWRATWCIVLRKSHSWNRCWQNALMYSLIQNGILKISSSWYHSIHSVKNMHQFCCWAVPTIKSSYWSSEMSYSRVVALSVFCVIFIASGV